ncbi:hypothetical protein ACHAXR_012898 [Thalassiosira sp. AJA248-18]
MSEQTDSSSNIELASLIGRNNGSRTADNDVEPSTEGNISAGKGAAAKPLGSGYSRIIDVLLFLVSFASLLVLTNIIFNKDSSFADDESMENDNSFIGASWTKMRWNPISIDNNCLPGFQLANSTIHCGIGDLTPLTTDSDGTEYCGGVKMKPNYCILPTEGAWTTPVGDSIPPLPRRLGINNASNILPRCKTMEKLINGTFEGEGLDLEWVPESCSAVPLSPFAWTENTKCKTTITMMGDSHIRNLYTATVSGLRGMEAFAEAHNPAGKGGGEVRSYEWRLKDGRATDRTGIYFDARNNEPIPFEDCPCDEVQRCLRIAFIWATTFNEQLSWVHLAEKWDSNIIIVEPGNSYEHSLVLSSDWTAKFDEMLQQNNNLQLGILHFVWGNQPIAERTVALREWTTNSTHANRKSYLRQSDIVEVNGKQSRKTFHFACGLGKVEVENDEIKAAQPCTDMTDTAQIRALVTVHFDALLK